MNSDEAASGDKPHSTGNGFGEVKWAGRIYGTLILILTLIFLSLCAYGIFADGLNPDSKLKSRSSTKKVEVITERNYFMQQGKMDILAQNEMIRNENEELKKQNEQLMNANRELTEDNIALQNSLKIAASVGIKPQNYTRFEGISRGELERGEYAGRFLGTAYTPSVEECGNNKGITQSGKPIIPGVSIAVDTKYWPIGTVFYIRGLGYAVAMDTGGAIKGKYRFDFAVFDRKFAHRLGARYWDMYVVKYGSGKVKSVGF